jgi:ammonia channel protein AmtB
VFAILPWGKYPSGFKYPVTHAKKLIRRTGDAGTAVFITINNGCFGSEALGGLGGVSFTTQLITTLAGITVSLIGGTIVYGLVNKVMGLRMSEEDEYTGADISIHSIGAVNHD